MPSNNLDELGQLIITQLKKYFGNRIRNFELHDVYALPYSTMKVSFTFYNYFVARVLLENELAYFYILVDGRVLEIFEKPVHVDKLHEILPLFDQNVKLRIPDKFLNEKAWIPLVIG